MKNLYLVRHAKPDSYDQDVADIDRSLIESGIEEARLMCKYLLAQNIKVDRILCSPALRTFSTAQIFAEAGLFKEASIVLMQELYNSSVKDYIKILSEQSDSVSSLFLFGHNPSISELLGYLSKGRELEMSTCSVAQLEFSVDSWKMIEQRGGKNLGTLNPSSLKSL